MGAFARDNAFISVLAAKHWLSKFGEVTSLAGMTVYKISESQKVLLNTTIALCAIRCYGNKVTADMVTSLLRVVKPRTAQEVRLFQPRKLPISSAENVTFSGLVQHACRFRPGSSKSDATPLQ